MKREWLQSTISAIKEAGFELNEGIAFFKTEKNARETLGLPPRGTEKVKRGKVGLHFRIDKAIVDDICSKAKALGMHYQDYILYSLGYLSVKEK